MITLSINKLQKPKNCEMVQMTSEYCPRGCGCRLATDGVLIWCSYIKCNYIIKREVVDGKNKTAGRTNCDDSELVRLRKKIVP